MRPPSRNIVIVTPALAAANNGNWQTARRWQRFLAPLYPTRLVKAWPDAQAAADTASDTAMIALHARRSADSIAAWHARHGAGRLALVLTGTDLYRDIACDAAAQRSLALAARLVVLQACGAAGLPPALRHKTRTIYQSAPPRRPLEKTARHLRALMVGHLREEKSPATLFAAARLLAGRSDILIDHIGAALDPELGSLAQATQAACPHYRWLGGLAHEHARRRMQQAHLLIHPSRMEGGAQVIIEAVQSGTPVLASLIDGNRGMLGDDYAGYFAWNDAAALARLLAECRATQADHTGLLAALHAQCHERAALFAPASEQAAVRALVTEMLG